MYQPEPDTDGYEKDAFDKLELILKENESNECITLGDMNGRNIFFNKIFNWRLDGEAITRCAH